MSLMMNVDHQNKYLFIHIPRTGGTTIEYQLHFKKRGWQAFKEDDFKTWPTQHYNIPQIFQFKTFYLWQYFVFTIVRNPWDRFVSEYMVRQAGGVKETFSELLDMTEHCVDLYNKGVFYNNGVHKNISHFIPQHTFVYYGGIKIPSFVGRFEEYENALKHISEQIDYPVLTKFHMHKTNHDHYSKYYSWKDRKRLGRLYAEDIRLFKYRFQKEN